MPKIGSSHAVAAAVGSGGTPSAGADTGRTRPRGTSTAGFPVDPVRLVDIADGTPVDVAA